MYSFVTVLDARPYLKLTRKPRPWLNAIFRTPLSFTVFVLSLLNIIFIILTMVFLIVERFSSDFSCPMVIISHPIVVICVATINTVVFVMIYIHYNTGLKDRTQKAPLEFFLRKTSGLFCYKKLFCLYYLYIIGFIVFLILGETIIKDQSDACLASMQVTLALDWVLMGLFLFVIAFGFIILMCALNYNTIESYEILHIARFVLNFLSCGIIFKHHFQKTGYLDDFGNKIPPISTKPEKPKKTTGMAANWKLALVREILFPDRPLPPDIYDNPSSKAKFKKFKNILLHSKKRNDLPYVEVENPSKFQMIKDLAFMKLHKSYEEEGVIEPNRNTAVMDKLARIILPTKRHYLEKELTPEEEEARAIEKAQNKKLSRFIRLRNKFLPHHTVEIPPDIEMATQTKRPGDEGQVAASPTPDFHQVEVVTDGQSMPTDVKTKPGEAKPGFIDKLREKLKEQMQEFLEPDKVDEGEIIIESNFNGGPAYISVPPTENKEP